eukprot:248810_1
MHAGQSLNLTGQRILQEGVVGMVLMDRKTMNDCQNSGLSWNIPIYMHLLTDYLLFSDVNEQNRFQLFKSVALRYLRVANLSPSGHAFSLVLTSERLEMEVVCDTPVSHRLWRRHFKRQLGARRRSSIPNLKPAEMPQVEQPNISESEIPADNTSTDVQTNEDDYLEELLNFGDLSRNRSHTTV